VVVCGLCGGEAVARVDYLGTHLCERHFREYFEGRVLATIRGLGMLERGEHVGVAVSGGKDSLALLYLLARYRDLLGVELTAIAVDEGIEWYRGYKLEALRRYAGAWGVGVEVRSFRDVYGFTLDEAVRALVEDGLRVKPCTVCGVFRRYVLNKAALELGVDRLATAHNMDDEAQVFLMNALKAQLDALARERPSSGRLHGLLVPRVKPFYFVKEKEVMVYALLSGIETPRVECPYIAYSTRHVIRRWLNAVELEDPQVKYRLVAMKEVLAGLAPGPEGEPRTCRVCGMPSSRDVCKSCHYSGMVRRTLSRLDGNRF